MQEFIIEVEFTYSGSVHVNANSKQEAIEYVEKHCGHIDSRGFHTVLGDDEIPDWQFPVHPEKRIVSIM